MEEKSFSTCTKGYWVNLISLSLILFISITFVLLISGMSPKEIFVSVCMLTVLIIIVNLCFLYLLKRERLERILIINQDYFSIKYGKNEVRTKWEEVNCFEAREYADGKIEGIKLITSNNKSTTISSFENMNQIYDIMIALLSRGNVSCKKIAKKYNFNSPVFIMSLPVIEFLVFLLLYYLWF